MTRLPFGGFPYTAEELQAAPAYFPLVGLVVGAIAGLTFIIASPLGPIIASTLSLIFTVWLTGAFHEDGLADTADAMGGAHSQKKLLDILKDSRIGTYGGAALALSLMLRVSVLSSLPLKSLFDFSGSLSAPVALIISHCLARTAPVVLMATLPYVAGERSKGAAVAAGGHGPQAILAGAFATALLLILGLLGVSPLLLGLLVVSTCLSTWRLHKWFKSRAGGYTGDFLGATEQILEMLLLLIIFAEPLLRRAEFNYAAWL